MEGTCKVYTPLSKIHVPTQCSYKARETRTTILQPACMQRSFYAHAFLVLHCAMFYSPATRMPRFLLIIRAYSDSVPTMLDFMTVSCKAHTLLVLTPRYYYHHHTSHTCSAHATLLKRAHAAHTTRIQRSCNALAMHVQRSCSVHLFPTHSPHVPSSCYTAHILYLATLIRGSCSAYSTRTLRERSGHVLRYRGIPFRLRCFLNDGAPYHNIVENSPFVLHGSRCVPGPWAFSSGSSFIFSESVFGRGGIKFPN